MPNSFSKKIIFGLVLLSGGAFYVCGLFSSQLLSTIFPAKIIPTSTIVISVAPTSSEEFLPILKSQKDRIDYFTGNSLANSGDSQEVLFATSNEIQRLDLPQKYFGESIYPKRELAVSTSIKNIAISSDGTYLAYTVRAKPFPPSDDDYCLEGTGDTVVLFNRATQDSRKIYVTKGRHGVTNLQFLPGRDELFFVDENAYIFNPSKTELHQLYGFNPDKDNWDEHTDICSKLSFFAFSPNGRYAVVHYNDHSPAAVADYIYDIEKDKLLGAFPYPDDFGGRIILGFVSNDRVLVYDDEFRDYQKRPYPQFSIFDLQGNPLLLIATTSQANTFSLPTVFATSSLGWHIMTYPLEGGQEVQRPLIFDPHTFRISSSTVSMPLPDYQVIWYQNDTSSRLKMTIRDLDETLVYEGNIADVRAR
jgi:hypothetical protein